MLCAYFNRKIITREREVQQAVERDLVNFEKLIISPHSALFIVVRNEDSKPNTTSATIYRTKHCNYF